MLPPHFSRSALRPAAIHRCPPLLSLLGLLVITASATAQEDAAPAAAAPAETAPAAPHPAIRYAQRDAARAADQARAAAERAAAAAQQAVAIEQKLAAAQAAKATADKMLAQLPARIQALEALQAPAAKSTEAAALASKTAAAPALRDAALAERFQTVAASTAALQASFVKGVETQRASIKTYEAQKADADKQIADATAALKPLQEARAAADKASAEAAKTAQAAADRVKFFESTPNLQPDPAKIRLVQTFQHNAPFLSCRIDATGEFVFGGAQDNSIQRWELATGSKLAFGNHRSWVGALVCPSESLALVSAAYDGQIRWWNPAAMATESVRTIDAHKGFARVVTVSPDGKYLATGGNDNLVKVWSTADGTLVSTLAGHENHVYHVAFHPNGQHLVSGDLMGVMKHWSTETWQVVRDLEVTAELHKFDPTFVAHCGGTRAMAFSPDGKLFVVGGIGEVSNAFAGVGKPTAVVFEWETGKKLQKLETTTAFTGSIWGLQFDPTGTYIVAAGGGGGGGAIWVWKPDTPKSVADFKLPAAARDLSLHPDGFRVAVALHDNTVRLYDLAPQPPAPETAAK